MAPKTGRVEARLSEDERVRIDRAAQIAGQFIDEADRAPRLARAAKRAHQSRRIR